MLGEEMHVSEALLYDLSDGVKSNDILVCNKPDEFLHILQKRFPMSFQKVDWSKLNEVIEVNANLNKYYEDGLAFFDFVCNIRCLNSEVIVFNDGAYDYSLHMNLQVLKKYLLRLLQAPQNTYVLSENFNWCMAFTMEHRFNFGVLPERV